MHNPILLTAICAVVSFFIGAIPFGLILGRVFNHTDIRKAGSGNIGTTNALLGNVPGVQGMKTGYTNKAGYCFVGLSYSARGNTYISVVLGADSSSARWQDSRILLTYAYNH